MNIFCLKKHRWLYCCLCFFIFSCQENTSKNISVDKRKSERSQQSILSAIKYIKSGDIITRTGNDFTSESLRSLNQRNKTYSHCGIASIENDTVFIYHSIGGDWNPDQKLKRELFELFSNPKENRGFGIFRYRLDSITEINLMDTVHLYYKEMISFDMDFDLKTDHKMYCAEFVGKCLEKASDKKIKIPHSFLKNFEFIGVDDIIMHSNCEKIMEIVYK